MGACIESYSESPLMQESVRKYDYVTIEQIIRAV